MAQDNRFDPARLEQIERRLQVLEDVEAIRNLKARYAALCDNQYDADGIASLFTGMRATDPGDAARIELLLAELRLPAIKLIWASLAAQADKEGWPNTRLPSAPAAASNATSPKPGCRLARPSTLSTSTPSRWSARPKSWRSPPAMRG